MKTSLRPPDKSVFEFFLISQANHNYYVVGTQKNCLNETVLLSTHMFKLIVKKIITILR